MIIYKKDGNIYPLIFIKNKIKDNYINTNSIESVRCASYEEIGEKIDMYIKNPNKFTNLIVEKDCEYGNIYTHANDSLKSIIFDKNLTLCLYENNRHKKYIMFIIVKMNNKKVMFVKDMYKNLYIVDIAKKKHKITEVFEKRNIYGHIFKSVTMDKISILNISEHKDIFYNYLKKQAIKNIKSELLKNEKII